MQCEKCGLELFSRPMIQDGERIPRFECKNKQCECYVPDAQQAAQIITDKTTQEGQGSWGAKEKQHL